MYLTLVPLPRATETSNAEKALLITSRSYSSGLSLSRGIGRPAGTEFLSCAAWHGMADPLLGAVSRTLSVACQTHLGREPG